MIITMVTLTVCVRLFTRKISHHCMVTSDDNDDINTDWQRWSDAFMAAVKDHIPIKRLKGRNPLPWINGTILNLIKKKNSIRQKLKKSPLT